MTAPTAPLLIPAVEKRTLPIPRHGDITIDFRNRDPSDHTTLVDYPAGTIGVFTLETETPTVVTATPTGSSCLIRIPAEQLDLVKRGTLYSFVLRYPDAEYADGFYDKVVVNGTCDRTDGK